MHAALTGGMHAIAGALLRSLAENQPFIDGNKRIAWTAAVVFLDLNGITVEATPDAVVALMLNVASPL